MAGCRQRWVYRIEPSRFPPDFPERLESFRESAGLSSRGLARLLRVDNRTLRRWRRGTTPDPGRLVALFDLAAGLGLLHILLPSVMGHQGPTRGTPPNGDWRRLICRPRGGNDATSTPLAASFYQVEFTI